MCPKNIGGTLIKNKGQSCKSPSMGTNSAETTDWPRIVTLYQSSIWQPLTYILFFKCNFSPEAFVRQKADN